VNPLRVLLVDDDKDLLQTIADHLRTSLKVIVETATSVPAALAAIEESAAFDLLVSDFNLPPHTAHDLEDHLRNARNYTPLILHSGIPAIEESRFHPQAYLGLVPKPGTRELASKILERFPQAKKS
jgi:CheY-like chemotaxis protein